MDGHSGGRDQVRDALGSQYCQELAISWMGKLKTEDVGKDFHVCGENE